MSQTDLLTLKIFLGQILFMPPPKVLSAKSFMALTPSLPHSLVIRSLEHFSNRLYAQQEMSNSLSERDRAEDLSKLKSSGSSRVEFKILCPLSMAAKISLTHLV